MHSPSDKDAGAAAGAQGLRWLVVSGDAVTRTLAVRMLDRLGHAADVRPAVPAAARWADPYGVLLLDTAALPADLATLALPDEVPPELILLTGPGTSAPDGLPVAARLEKPLNLPALSTVASDLAERHAATQCDPAPWDELHRLFGAGGLGDMIGALRRDLPDQTARLQAALQAADRDGIRRLAHALRGVALQFGAERFASQCADLERACAEGATPAMLDAPARQVLSTYRRLIRQLALRLDGH